MFDRVMNMPLLLISGLSVVSDTSIPVLEKFSFQYKTITKD